MQSCLFIYIVHHLQSLFEQQTLRTMERSHLWFRIHLIWGLVLLSRTLISSGLELEGNWKETSIVNFSKQLFQQTIVFKTELFLKIERQILNFIRFPVIVLRGSTLFSIPDIMEKWHLNRKEVCFAHNIHTILRNVSPNLSQIIIWIIWINIRHRNYGIIKHPFRYDNALSTDDIKYGRIHACEPRITNSSGRNKGLYLTWILLAIKMNLTFTLSNSGYAEHPCPCCRVNKSFFEVSFAMSQLIL